MSVGMEGESLAERVGARTVELLVSSGQFCDAEAETVREVLCKEGVTGERLMEAVEGLDGDVDANP